MGSRFGDGDTVGGRVLLDGPMSAVRGTSHPHSGEKARGMSDVVPVGTVVVLFLVAALVAPTRLASPSLDRALPFSEDDDRLRPGHGYVRSHRRNTAASIDGPLIRAV
jgi:hypothetical protein